MSSHADDSASCSQVASLVVSDSESDAGGSGNLDDAFTDTSTKPSTRTVVATIEVSQLLTPLESKLQARLDSLEQRYGELRVELRGESDWWRRRVARADAEMAACGKRLEVVEGNLITATEVSSCISAVLTPVEAKLQENIDVVQALVDRRCGELRTALQTEADRWRQILTSLDASTLRRNDACCGGSTERSDASTPEMTGSLRQHVEVLQAQMHATTHSLQSYLEKEASKIATLSEGLAQFKEERAGLQQNVNEVWQYVKTGRQETKDRFQELLDHVELRFQKYSNDNGASGLLQGPGPREAGSVVVPAGQGASTASPCQIDSLPPVALQGTKASPREAGSTVISARAAGDSRSHDVQASVASRGVPATSPGRQARASPTRRGPTTFGHSASPVISHGEHSAAMPAAGVPGGNAPNCGSAPSCGSNAIPIRRPRSPEAQEVQRRLELRTQGVGGYGCQQRAVARTAVLAQQALVRARGAALSRSCHELRLE